MPRLAVAALVVIGSVAPFQAQTPQLGPEGFPAAGAPAIVTLLSQGAEPRRALRLSVPQDYKEHMDMSVAMVMSMDLEGLGGQQITMPTMNMGLDLAVTSISSEGDITYNMTATGMTFEAGPDVDPNLLAALQGTDTGVDKFKTTMTVTSRGVAKDAATDLSTVVDPQMKQLMESMNGSLKSFSVSLPEEPVGPGARWEIRQRVPSNGVDAFTKTTVDVVSIDGQKVALKFTSEQSAPAQAVSNPMLPPGTEVQLERMTGTGSGTGTLNLAGLVPTSEVQMKMDMSMSVSMNGTSMSMQSTNSVKMKVAPGSSR